MSLAEFGDGVSRPSPRATTRDDSAPIATNGLAGSPAPADGIICQYAVLGDKYLPTARTIAKLSAGAYGMVATQAGLVFQHKQLNVDELIEFPGSKNAAILQEVDDFWARKDLFERHAFLHRRGFLFYGPAGGGKTSMVQQITASVIKGGDLVFIMDCQPGMFRNGLHQFRTIEPTRRLVCVFEDIDTIIDRYGEDEMLALLDGEQQIDSVFNIATTNYPGKLDRRFIARPRRFDRIIKVGMPTASMRKVFFTRKLKVADAEIDRWVTATDQFSFAACAELVIAVLCLGNDFDKSVKRLKDMQESLPKDADASAGRAAGFAVGSGSEED